MKSWIFCCIIALSSLLSGCSWFTKTVYVEKKVFAYPPVYLMKDCQIDYLEGTTLGDLVDLAVKQEQNLMDCNLTKKGLRDWSSKSQLQQNKE